MDRSLPRAGAKATRLRLEGMLAAFAAGDDDGARAYAGDHPELLQLLARVPAASRAVSLIAAGELGAARRALARVPAAARFELRTSAISATGAVAARASDAAVRRAAISLARQDERVREAAARELAPTHSVDALSLASSASRGAQAAARVWARHAEDATPSPRQTLESVRAGGTFVDPTAPAALLYGGFAAVGGERIAAREVLARAGDAGADVTEVRRGEWLAAGRGSW